MIRSYNIIQAKFGLKNVNTASIAAAAVTGVCRVEIMCGA